MLLCGQEPSSILEGILSREASSMADSLEDLGAPGWHGTGARTQAFNCALRAGQERGSREDPMALRGALRWDPDVAFELCAEGQEAEYEGRVQFLDKAVVKSVRAAAQGLNEGHIWCRDGVCAAFSEERRQWYILHAPGSKEAALACAGRAAPHAPPAAALGIPAAAQGRARPAVRGASPGFPAGGRRGVTPEPAGLAEPLRTPRMTALAAAQSALASCPESRRPSPSPRESTPPCATTTRGPSPREAAPPGALTPRGLSLGLAPQGSASPVVRVVRVVSSPRLPEVRAATPPCLARQAAAPPRVHESASPTSPPVDETFSARYHLPQDSNSRFESPQRVLVPGGHAGASMPQQSSSASVWLGRERTVAEAMIEHRRIALEQRQVQREQEEDEKQQQQADVLRQQQLERGMQRSQSMQQQQHQRLQQHLTSCAHELHRQLATEHQEASSASPRADWEDALASRALRGAEPLGDAGADRLCQQAPAAAAPAAAPAAPTSAYLPVAHQRPSSRGAASSGPAASLALEEASPEAGRLRAELREARQQAQAMREEAARSAEENAAVGEQLQEALRASQEAQALRERLEQLGPELREASDLRRQLESAQQALQEDKETRAKLEAAQAVAQEVVLLRQALDTAQGAARDVEGLRQQLRDEKRDFCQHLEKIESVVASLSVRERDLAARVVELTEGNEALAARLVQQKECQGHSSSASVSTHSGGPSSSASSSTGGCSGVMPEGSKDTGARDLLKEEVSQKDGAITLLQSKADMAQRKLKLADMENAMLKRQLLALRKLRSDGDDG